MPGWGVGGGPVILFDLIDPGGQAHTGHFLVNVQGDQGAGTWHPRKLRLIHLKMVPAAPVGILLLE